MIKEIREVSNVNVANKLLKEEWTILGAVSNPGDQGIIDRVIYIRVLHEKKNFKKMQGCRSNISKREYEMRLLEEVCTPVANYLKKNRDPHCMVVITDNQIRLVRDEIGIPVGTAQEVPVQEQNRLVPTDSSGTIYPENQSSIKCQSNQECYLE